MAQQPEDGQVARAFRRWTTCGRFKSWIEPAIGDKAMNAVTPADIEAIVEKLDEAFGAWRAAAGGRGEGRLSPSTAANVWGDLAHAFDEAVSAKDKSLRVLCANPCANVRGPDTGDDREGPILYSDEILALLRGKAAEPDGKDVPLYRRRTYAVAIYTAGRRSELSAIDAPDVDKAHGTISISKQVARRKAKAADAGRRGRKSPTKQTKTGRARTVDIEPHLYPLIEVLIAEVKGGRLLRVPPIEDCAELLRQDLWTVGVRRPELHHGDATRTPMTFHCLRDTCLTHMAVRGARQSPSSGGQGTRTSDDPELHQPGQGRDAAHRRTAASAAPRGARFRLSQTFAILRKSKRQPTKTFTFYCDPNGN